MSSQPAIVFGLVAGKIVQHHMDLLIGMSGQHLVHELQKISATPAPVVAGLNLAASNVQSSKKG
jgi:hypothetical protein